MAAELFKLHTADDIVEACGRDARPLSKYLRGKLSQVRGDVLFMLNALQKLIDCEICAEVVFIDDDGRELYCENKALADAYLQIAANGQGDAWLLGLKDGLVVFFDHDTGTITSLYLDFCRFLQLADLLAQWEAYSAEHDSPPAEALEQMRGLMTALHSQLPDNYPFELT